MDMTETATVTGTHTPGAFVWHELRTKDVAQAKAFYTGLFGWTYQQAKSLPGVEYHLIQLGDKQIGGVFNATGHEMPSHWGGLISVPDVDQAAEATTAAGGEICAPPQDIPGVGRFVMIFDPQGVSVGLYKTLHGDPDTSKPLEGEFCWDQLNTTDMAGAAAFYQKVVGWSQEQPTPGMSVFTYGDALEASLGLVQEGIPPHWLTFIAVGDLSQATQKAQTLGATVLMANVEAGPWGRFSVIQDPVGAVFALFQPNEH
jgi:predicted enzyme related to lactoylglutathione lyase